MEGPFTKHQRCGTPLISTDEPDVGYCLHCWTEVFYGEIPPLVPEGPLELICEYCDIPMKQPYNICKRCSEELGMERIKLAHT